jgi:hypothetical protein
MAPQLALFSRIATVRRQLRVGAACGAATVVLAACGADGSGENTEGAATSDPSSTRVAFYDWEPNVIPNPRASPGSATELAFARLYDAVEVAGEEKPECFEDRCTTAGPTDYAFDPKSKEPIDDPDSAGAEVLTVQQGTIVVKADSDLGYYVLRDRPSLLGDELRDPDVISFPATGEPAIGFGFTEAGERDFEELTERIVDRALEFGWQTGHFALVVGDEVISRPTVDVEQSPNGLDASNGATVAGGLTQARAEEIVELLEENGAG